MGGDRTSLAPPACLGEHSSACTIRLNTRNVGTRGGANAVPEYEETVGVRICLQRWPARTVDSLGLVDSRARAFRIMAKRHGNKECCRVAGQDYGCSVKGDQLFLFCFIVYSKHRRVYSRRSYLTCCSREVCTITCSSGATQYSPGQPRTHLSFISYSPFSTGERFPNLFCPAMDLLPARASLVPSECCLATARSNRQSTYRLPAIKKAGLFDAIDSRIT